MVLAAQVAGARDWLAQNPRNSSKLRSGRARQAGVPVAARQVRPQAGTIEGPAGRDHAERTGRMRW